jgi:HAD superfamily hydrolase (TIGR01509 family)
MTAFIFDVDGTLAETERYGHRVAFNRAFAEAGLNWDWSESLYGELLAISGGKERIRYYITHYLGEDEFPHNIQEFAQQLHQSKSHHYRQLLQEGNIPLRPGVKRLLEEAHDQGIRLAVATTSSLENTIALLEYNLGRTKTYFEVIAAGDIVPNKKPAPDIYNYVLAEMELSSQDCLVFEDSQPGLSAATSAGLRTVITVNDYTAQQDFSDAILVLNHLGEPDYPFTIYSNPTACNATYFDVALGNNLLQG